MKLLVRRISIAAASLAMIAGLAACGGGGSSKATLDNPIPQVHQQSARRSMTVGTTVFTVTAGNDYKCQLQSGQIFCSQTLDYYASASCYMNGRARAVDMSQLDSGSDIIDDQSSASAWYTAIKSSAATYAGAAYAVGTNNEAGCPTS